MQITGTWKLIRTTAEAEDGSSLPGPFGGDQAIGRLVLDASGRMMGAIVDGRNEVPAGQQRQRTFYSGAYTFDGKQLVTSVDVSIDADRVGGKQVRDVAFEGKFMVLRPPLRKYHGRMERHALWWEKIEG
ncbi:MAG: lipocalin-like domain-containing protein [Proteobacteria bacterium]|nr:lipocalin-like domain-containing protein [Pseudomonadota bacterium]